MALDETLRVVDANEALPTPVFEGPILRCGWLRKFEGRAPLGPACALRAAARQCATALTAPPSSPPRPAARPLASALLLPRRQPGGEPLRQVCGWLRPGRYHPCLDGG